MSLDDSDLMNYLVRMVVPMRREFGRKLDIGQFMHDFAYATEVLAQARGSQDARLREYGLYVEKRMHGALPTPPRPRPRRPPPLHLPPRLQLPCRRPPRHPPKPPKTSCAHGF